MEYCDVDLNYSTPYNRVNVCGTDKSGIKQYIFNSRGYRGEEYNLDAPIKFAVIGCSLTFGTGLNLEETFSYKFKDFCSAALEIDSSEINMINLAAGGQSNDYCVRTLYRQIPGVALDLLIFNLSVVPRFEYPSGDEFLSFNVKSAYGSSATSLRNEKLGFYQFYNKEIGDTFLLKNLLLAQSLLKSNEVDYIFSNEFFDIDGIEDAYHARSFVDALDREHVLEHSFLRHRSADLAADDLHAGARSHTALAIAQLEFYGRMLVRRGNTDWGNRLAGYAAELKRTNEDWAYCEAYSRSFDPDREAAIAALSEAMEIYPDGVLAEKRLRELGEQT